MIILIVNGGDIDTKDVIRKRASLKTAVSNRPIDEPTLNAILEAGRLAPSARNMQPWHFVVVRDRKMIEAVVSAGFTEQNAVIRQSAAIVFIFAKPADDIIRDGKEYYLFDCGLAVENLVLAATDAGLVTHIMSAANETEIKRVLHIPADFRFVVCTPVSYPAAGSYDKAAQERLSQRTRKGLDEIVFYDEWDSEPA